MTTPGPEEATAVLVPLLPRGSDNPRPLAGFPRVAVQRTQPNLFFSLPKQAVYTVGLLTLMIYYAHFRLWPVFYPMAFEFSCLVYLTGLKTYYEVSMSGRVAYWSGAFCRPDS